MTSTEQVLKEMKFTNEIMELIEDISSGRYEFTQSDLQGVVGAIVKNIIASK